MSEQSTATAADKDYPPGSSAAERRSIAKWYAAARAALARNRPLTTTSAATSSHPIAAVFTASETEALTSVGAFKDAAVSADNDPLLGSQAQYMALLEDSLSTTEAAKFLKVDVSRVRQRLRDRSLFGIEHEGSWRLPRFQFEGRHVIPGLAQVLRSLPSDLFPLDVVDWFLLPESDLQLDTDATALSPRAWLLSGRPVEAVVSLACDLTRA